MSRTPRGRSGVPLALAIVAAVVVALLCCVGGVLWLAFSSDDEDSALNRPVSPVETSDVPAVPADDAPDPDEPRDASIGDVLTITEYGDPVGTLTVSELESTQSAESEYGSGPEREYFVIFTVELECTDGVMNVFAGDFYILDEEGNRTEEGNGNAFGAVDYDDSIGFTELSSGERRTGVLVFDLEVRSGTLVYNPNYDGQPLASWDFDAS